MNGNLEEELVGGGSDKFPCHKRLSDLRHLRPAGPSLRPAEGEDHLRDADAFLRVPGFLLHAGRLVHALHLSSDLGME